MPPARHGTCSPGFENLREHRCRAGLIRAPRARSTFRTAARPTPAEAAFASPRTPQARLLDQSTHTQLTLSALEVALFRLLEARGRVAHVVCGHSICEVAAAHAAGFLSFADACVVARGVSLPVCRRRSRDDENGKQGGEMLPTLRAGSLARLSHSQIRSEVLSRD